MRLADSGSARVGQQADELRDDRLPCWVVVGADPQIDAGHSQSRTQVDLMRRYSNPADLRERLQGLAAAR